MAEKSIKELWQDYLFLTKEMEKFLEQQELDMLLELLEQRGQIQKLIAVHPDKEFVQSPEAKELLPFLQQANRRMTTKLRYMLNTAKYNRQVSNAYDAFSGNTIGSFINRQS
jgi:aminopeptidase C